MLIVDDCRTGGVHSKTIPFPCFFFFWFQQARKIQADLIPQEA